MIETCVMALTSDELGALLGRLSVATPELDDAARLERIHRLEQVKAAVAAAQAVETAAFVRARRAAAELEVRSTARPGVGRRRRLAEHERGIRTDLATARRLSPAQAARAVTFAIEVRDQLPLSFGLLARGGVSERRLQLVQTATAWLESEQRRALDTEIAPKLSALGDREVTRTTTRIAQRLDPAGAVRRAARAEKERRVTLRPAPESMTWLTALCPLVQGVQIWASLDRAARTAVAGGDTRTHDQIMADTLHARVTGLSEADAGAIEIQLVMSDHTLLGRSNDPAWIVGYGTLAAPLARRIALSRPDALPAKGRAARRVRRLFTEPAGRIVAMESHSRCFTPAMAAFIRIRDDVCSTPWCDAPIRHIDHVTPFAESVTTRVVDGRGTCARCNYAAQAPGAVSRTVERSDGSTWIVTRSPAGQVTTDVRGEASSVRTSTHTSRFEVVWEPRPDLAA